MDIKQLKLPRISPPEPTTLLQAMSGKDAQTCATAHGAELTIHTTELKTWYFDDELPNDKPLPYIMTYRAKTNMYGGLERHNVLCDIRGDRMTPNLNFDTTRTTSHTRSEAGRRLLVAAAAAQDYSIQSWDVPGAHMRALNDSRHRMTMRQPPCSDGTYEAAGKAASSDALCKGHRIPPIVRLVVGPMARDIGLEQGPGRTICVLDRH